MCKKLAKLWHSERPSSSVEKKYTNLFKVVKYTMASQMNYVRRLLISKNDNFNQHFTFFPQHYSGVGDPESGCEKNHRYLKGD